MTSGALTFRSRLSPSRLAARAGVHYGWVMVATMFMLILVSTGVRSAPAVLIQPLEEDMDWSRGQISYALSVSLLLFGLAAPVSGKLNDRYGIRATSLVFLAVTSVGVTVTATINHLWQLHLYWGVIVGFFSGGISLVVSAAVANTWFHERRGLVTGILGSASSAGQFVFLQILIRIIDAWGWRQAVGFLAVVLVLVAFPVALWLIRSRPADTGLQPYGASGATEALADNRQTAMSHALRTGDFWLLALSFAVCGFTTIGLIGTHFVAHATEHGFSKNQAAGILSVIGLMNIVGTIGSGWLTDRFSPRRLLAFYYFLRALSLLALPMLGTLPLMSLFAVAFGLDYIATVPPTIMLTADRFGRRSVGTIYGWITFSHMAGGAVAASLAGRIHDSAGDYAIPIYIAGILALVAAGLAFNINARYAPARAEALAAAS